MTAHGDDLLRGGYYKAQLNNTFSRQEGNLQWYVTGPPPIGGDLVFSPTGVELVFATADFQLFSVDARVSAIAAAGQGFYHCEPNHCWTSGSFEIEVLAGNSSPYWEVIIESDYFKAPPDGQIAVNVDGKDLISVPSSQASITLLVPRGFSKIRFTPSWQLTSPMQTGISADTRTLFAMVKSVRIRRKN